MADATPAVEITDLVKDFKTKQRKQPLRAVDKVSLRIMPGEVYGLIGPNGSGKSTTMKALLGLLAPTSGQCKIFGKDSIKVDSTCSFRFRFMAQSQKSIRLRGPATAAENWIAPILSFLHFFSALSMHLVRMTSIASASCSWAGVRATPGVTEFSSNSWRRRS